MGWTVLYASHQAHLIEIVKNILEEHAIQYVVVDKKDRMYQSVLEPNIEIHIQNEDYIRGKNLISSLEN